MTRKIAYYTLAVVAAVVLAAGMLIGSAGPVLADNEGTGVHGTTDYSFSSEPEMGMELSDAERSASRSRPGPCQRNPR